MIPESQVPDNRPDKDSKARGRIVHIFRDAPDIVAVRFTGAHEDLAVSVLDIRHAPKPQKRRVRKGR
jgi:hypothetical protein